MRCPDVKVTGNGEAYWPARAVGMREAQFANPEKPWFDQEAPGAEAGYQKGETGNGDNHFHDSPGLSPGLDGGKPVATARRLGVERDGG